MSSPIPSTIVSSDVEPEDSNPAIPVHSHTSRHATSSDEETEPTEESSEDFAVVPDINPALRHTTEIEDVHTVPDIAPPPDDPDTLAREGDPMSTDEDPSEADVSSPPESPLPSPPPPGTPPNPQNRIRRTARIRTTYVPPPPPHPYMLPNYVPPPNSPDPEDTLPSRKRTRSSTPPSSTDELSEVAKAAIA